MVHVIPGRRPVAEALRAGRPLRELVLSGEDGQLGALAASARAVNVRVRVAGRGEIDTLAQGVLHQGAVGVAGVFPYRTLAELPDCELVVVLDGVTDPHNLGAIARTAEIAGAGGLVLRERRSAHVTPAAEKAAAGAFSWLPVALVPNVVRALEDLAGRGFWSVGLAGGGDETLWSCRLLDGRVALVVGAEGAGLTRLVSERVDARVAIPARGRLASLNASTAAAVALFEIVRRRDGQGYPGGRVG